MGFVLITSNYKWILIEALVQIVLYLIFNFTGGAMRGKHFNPKFMAQFEPELAKVSKKPPPLGVPDCGNGKFSEKLSHKDWLEYNTVMFLAQSAIHSIYANLFVTLALGIYSNAAGIVVGLFLIVYRIAYSVVGRVGNTLLPILEPLNHILLFAGSAAIFVLGLTKASEANPTSV